MIYEPLMRAGADLILQIQQAVPYFDGIMLFFSFLGLEDFYILLVSFIFFCVDQRFAIRFLLLLSLSSFINSVAKLALHSPRPYWWDARIQGLATETSYGPPSGHSQNAVAVWGYLAHWGAGLKQNGTALIWIACGFIAFMISFSRMYLGVHFPHSIVLGWIIGAILLLAFIHYIDRAWRWYHQQSTAMQITLPLLFAGIAIAVPIFIRMLLEQNARLDNPIWAVNAAADQPDAIIAPRSLESMISNLAVFSATLIGAAFYERQAHFKIDDAWLRRLARFVLALIGVMVIRIGLSALFPREPELPAMILRFVRYSLMVLWAVWLAPLLFIRIGLAERAPQP
ncbi:MAG: phosphatase PAP2 family protein [Leptospiraceae bacterium]|nr:phosphatase PAP2 family protein [Leptospiraceae bacterium]MCB1320074.1 phosphatase PAP2 family protein [Leptospiraceae bacterium]